jgi:hypothetical protein
MLHNDGQRELAYLQEQVKMVFHKAIGIKMEMIPFPDFQKER